jgi:GTP-binding protein EngB required for normal cell division
MNRKWISFIFALLVSINCLSFAQMRMSHEDRVKQYSERLKLNEKQTKAVDAILTASDKKFQQINTDDQSKRFEEMRKIMDESNKKIEKLLTKAQKVEFQKMQEERRSRMNGQGPGAH